MAKNPYQDGMFNFGQMMEDFYKPTDKDDEAGRLQKDSFQGNFIQSAVDAQLAAGLSEQNAAIAQENMQAQADLEKTNALDLMKEEFKYQELGKDSNFENENKFANAQYDRDQGMLAATGEQQRENIREQANQDRLGAITQGEQDRLTSQLNNQSAEKIAEGKYSTDRYTADAQANASRDVATSQKEAELGSAQISADASRDTAKTQADADKFTATTQADAARDTAGIKADADKYSAKEAADASRYGADKNVDIANINVQGTLDNTKETGNQTRLTMAEETRQKAKDRANQHSYARSTARAM